MLSIFMSAVEATIVATAMPTIVSELGGFQLFSWVFAAYLLAQAVSTPLYGRLADLYGRKPIFVVGSATFLLGSAACGFTQSMLLLVICRMFQGLGAGSIQSLAFTIVGDIYQPNERARVQGWLSAVWGVAAIVGPTLGGFIVQHLHWAYVFWINLPIGAAAIMIVAAYLIETVAKRSHRVDLLGAALLMIGVGSVLIAVVQAQNLDPAWVIALFAAGVVALTLLVVWERRAAEPIVPFRIWRSRIMACGNIASLVLGALLVCVIVFLPTYIQGVMARTATAAGSILAMLSVSWSIGSIASGGIMTRTSYRTCGVLGALTLIAGTALLIVVDRDSGLIHLAIVVVLVGLGMGLANQTLLVAVQSSIGWKDRGAATASILFLRTIGQTLGAGLGGAILNFGVAHLAANADQSLNQLLDPARRAGLSPETVAHLTDAITTSLHHVYVIAGVLAVMTFAVMLIIPAGLRPDRMPGVSPQRGDDPA